MPKAQKPKKSIPVDDLRKLTAAQRAKLFLAARKEEAPDYQVLTKDWIDELVPYGLITFDDVLGLRGISRHGRVSQVHGDESVGKCLALNTLMSSDKGLLYIDEIFQDNGLVASCSNRITENAFPLINCQGEIEKTSHFTNNGRREVFKIKTRSGNELVNTANHEHYVMDVLGFWVWKATEELKTGDYLVCSRKAAAGSGANRTSDTDETLYFVGAMIADAAFGDKRVIITNDDPDVLAMCAAAGEQCFNKRPRIYNKNSSLGIHYSTKTGVEQFYQKYGITAGLAKDKQLGAYIRHLPPSQMRYVLQGYFDCECSIDDKGIEVTSASHKLLLEVKLVLQSYFGIISYLSPKKAAAYPDTPYWRLAIRGGEALLYNEMIGFKSELRQKQYAELFDTGVRRIPNLDVIPNCDSLLESLYRGLAIRDRKLYNLCRDYLTSNSKQASPTHSKLQEIVDALEAGNPIIKQRLQDIIIANYYYDEITEVSPADEEPTFDFTMPETHSFIANGVVSHNSTLTYVISKNYQEFTGEPVGIFDFEGTGTPAYLERIGADMDLVKLIQPDSMEESVKETLRLLKMGCRFFIYDSIPCMKSMIDEKDIMNGKAFKANYGKHAQTMAKFYDLLRPHVKKYDGHIFMINQTRARIDDSTEAQWANDYSYTNKTYVLPGGRVCRFAPSTMIELRMIKEVKPLDGKGSQNGVEKDPFVVPPATAATEGKPLWNRVRARTLKNKVTGAGYREGYIWVEPGRGINENMSVRELARDYGYIANKGPKWYVGKSIDEAIVTYPNKEAAIEDLVVNENPEVLQQLKALVSESIRNDNTGRHTSSVSAEEIQMIEGGDDGVSEPVGAAFEVEEL